MLSKKAKIKRMIKKGKKAIELLEKKRNRSLAALLEAMLNEVEPYEADVEFFKTYTAMIAVERENLTKLIAELLAKTQNDSDLSVKVK